MPSIRSAAFFSLGQRYVSFVMQLTVSVIVARLLTPAETGVFALGAAVSAIAQMLREFGVSGYIITERNLDQAKLRAAFTVTLLTAGGAGLVLLLLAWPIALAYDEPGAGLVLAVLSLNYFLLPLGMVPLAKLNKEMRFRELFWMHSGVGLFSAGVTVVMAYKGFSYMSLAYGAVASNLAMVSVLAVRYRREVFLCPTLRGLGEVFRFGGGLTLGRVADQVAARSNEVIVSGVLGFHSAGLLSKSQSLINSFNDFFASALSNVAVPALVKVRHEGGSIVEPYLKGTALMAPVLWIFFGLLGVFAHEVIYVLFGAQWMEAVPLLQVMCAGAMLWGPYILSYPLIVSMRLVGPLLRIQLWYAPITIGCILLGASIGLIWVAAVPIVATVVRMFMTQRILSRECGLAAARLMLGLAPSAASCAVVIAVALALRLSLLEAAAPSFIVLVVGSLGAVLVAVLLAAVQDHPLWQEVQRAVKRRP